MFLSVCDGTARAKVYTGRGKTLSDAWDNAVQLTKKDIAYRANAAYIKAFVCVNDPYVMEQMELAKPEAPCIREIFVTETDKEGWTNLDTEIMKYPDTFTRPVGEEATKILCRFISLPVRPECRRWSAITITTP